MHVPSHPRVVSSLETFSKVCGVVVVVWAAAVFLAWGYGHSSPAHDGTALIAMNPVTAIALLLGALSLLCLQTVLTSSRLYQVGRVLAAVTALIGVARLTHYAWGAPYSFDQWLFTSQLHGNVMAPLTALCTGLSGFALYRIDRKSSHDRWVSEYLAFGVASVTLLTIIGHLYQVSELIYRHTHYQPMALNTGACFLFLSVGILCARPDKGLMRVISSQGIGGITVRRLLPASILLPVLLGYLRLRGEQAGWYGMRFSAASFAISTLAISSTLIWWVARLLHRIENDRLEAEQETRESKSFLESIVDNIPDMIFIKDAAHLRMVLFNKAGETLLGLSRQKLIGKSDYDLFPKEQADFFVENDRRVLNNKTFLDIPEEPIKTPHGERLLHTKKIPLCDSQGNPTHLIGISEDITLRKQTEEELFQGKKLQAMGLLTAGLAHQLNNPLSAILTFAQYLKTQVASGHPLYGPIDTIERETRRCSELIQNLLAFSRKKQATMACTSPAAVIATALSLIESQVLMHHVQLLRQIPEDLPDFEVNAQQIQEVVINLCLNALDAMPSGGQLTVQALAPAAMGKNGVEHIEIRITDTGEGISEENRARIFEPFFTTKEVGKGTGLGLSFCYGIVKSHQGQIDVQSKPGQGSTFIVRIPRRFATESTHPLSSAA